MKKEPTVPHKKHVSLGRY